MIKFGNKIRISKEKTTKLRLFNKKLMILKKNLKHKNYCKKKYLKLSLAFKVINLIKKTLITIKSNNKNCKSKAKIFN